MEKGKNQTQSRLGQMYSLPLGFWPKLSKYFPSNTNPTITTWSGRETSNPCGFRELFFSSSNSIQLDNTCAPM